MVWSTFEGFIHYRTTRAVLFLSWYWGAPLWFPTSQVMMFEDGEATLVIKIKDWLTTNKGLHEFTEYSEDEIRQHAGQR